MPSPPTEGAPATLAALLRHLLLTPILGLLLLAGLAATPLLLVAAGVLALAVDRAHWRPIRGVLLLAVYAGCDLAVLLGAMALFLDPRSRGATWQERHTRLLGWALERFGQAAERILQLRSTVEGEPDARSALSGCRRPVVVLSRHQGPGDPFLIVRHLLDAGRRPRVVLRSALRLDPAIDVLGSRLPLAFVRRGSGGAEAALRSIRHLSAGMQPGDALLLFPEGGNATEDRRRRGIESLLRMGWRRRARQAARLHHLIAPHPRGALDALEARDDADVLFVAHTGLAGMHPLPWMRIPVHLTLRIHMWLVPAAHVPPGRAQKTEWLFDWWRRLDAWVAATID